MLFGTPLLQFFVSVVLLQNICFSVGCASSETFGLADYFLFSFLLFFSALWFLFDRENGGPALREFCDEGKQIIIPTDTTSFFSIRDAFPTVTIELISLIYIVYHAFCNWLTIILSTIVPTALIVYTVTENIVRTEQMN